MIRRRKQKTPRRPYRAARVAAAGGLFGVALLGAVNSWGSMYVPAATHLFGVRLPIIRGVSVAGATFPLLLDAFIVAASIRYVVGVKEQRPVAGWRVAAHTAIGGTVVMNALSARTLSDVPWHIVAPAVLSLIVELTARDILGQLREVRRVDADRIPLRLWLSAPAESVRTSWRMARTGERSAAAARASSDGCAAARDALRRTLPGTGQAKVRRQITRRLWTGTILPEDVFAACGWTGSGDRSAPVDADVILRAALRRLIDPGLTAQMPPGLTVDVPVADRPTSPPMTGQAGRKTPLRAVPSAHGRTVTPQVRADVPDGMTPSAATVLSYLLGKGGVRRAKVIGDLQMSESTVKAALVLLAGLGHVEAVGGGMYRSVDPFDAPESDRSADGQAGDIQTAEVGR